VTALAAGAWSGSRPALLLPVCNPLDQPDRRARGDRRQDSHGGTLTRAAGGARASAGVMDVEAALAGRAEPVLGSTLFGCWLSTLPT
jgi:hypothetical protein